MSADERARLERAAGWFDPPADSFERLVAKRERSRRRQQLSAAVVGLTVAAAISAALFLSGGFGDGTHTVSPAPQPPDRGGPDPDVTGARHVIEREGLTIVVPDDYVLVLDVRRFVQSLEDRGAEPAHIERFVDHPEIFILQAIRPGAAERTITVVRAGFKGDLARLSARHVAMLLNQGGSVLASDPAAVGNVRGEAITSRGRNGPLTITYLAVVDGYAWTFRMSVATGDGTEADAVEIEASALRSFERVIRSVDIS